MVQHPDLGRGQVVPGDRPDEGVHEKGDEIHRLEPVPEGAVCPGVEPGERDAQEGGQKRGSRTDEEGVEESPADDVPLNHLPVVLEAPLRAEAQIVEHEEAAYYQGAKWNQHHRHDEDADDYCDRVFSLEEVSQETPSAGGYGLRPGYGSHEILSVSGPEGQETARGPTPGYRIRDITLSG